MQKVTNKLEEFFWLFLFINPFLDIGNGLFIMLIENLYDRTWEQINLAFTPSLLIRMTVLVLFGLYLLLSWDKRALLTIVPIGVVWVLSVAGQIFWPMDQFSPFTDLQYIARFGYNLVVLFVYWRVFQHKKLSRERLLYQINRVITFTLAVLSTSILVAYAADMGYTTYADRFGLRGTRGFFYSGNDITAVLMVLLPVCICTFLLLDRKKCGIVRYIYQVYTPAATIATLCLIGTKTAFAAVGVAGVGLLGYSLYLLIHKKQKMPLIRLVIVGLACLILLGILALFSGNLFADISSSLNNTGNIARREGVATALLSGRQNKLGSAFQDFRVGGVYKWLFGITRGSQKAIIEMDVFEVLFYYGLVGAVFMLWPYLKLGFGFVLKFIKERTMVAFAMFCSLSLCAFYLFMAGHILFSVTSGFYFSFMLLYGKLLYSDNFKKEEI